MMNAPMPAKDQEAAGLFMVRLALFAAGAVAMVMWPFVLGLMVLRDRVGGCNFGTSDISGTGQWSFVPPQLTCTWTANQMEEIMAWSVADGGETPVLEAGASSLAEQIPVTAVSWVTFAMFVVGLILIRLAFKIKHRPLAPA